jgi:hypothetical protein
LSQSDPAVVPPARSTAKSETANEPVFVVWATIMMVWFTFGASTILNRIALESVNRDTDRLISDFPLEISDSIWLVLGIWIAAYIEGIVVGLRGSSIHSWSLIFSSSLGYTLAVLARIVILDVFPIAPRDAFSDIWGVVTLSGIPGYWSFVVLVLFVGQFFAGIAVFTGQVIAREMPQLRTPTFIDPSIVFAAIILPVAFLITGWGFVIILDESARVSLETSRFAQIELPYLREFLQPFAHLVVAILAGLVIGQLRHLSTIRSVVISASIGMMGYVTLIFLSKDMFLLYAPASFEDPIDLVLPNAFQFTLLWWGPVLMVAAAAGMILSIRELMFGMPSEPNSASVT